MAEENLQICCRLGGLIPTILFMDNFFPAAIKELCKCRFLPCNNRFHFFYVFICSHCNLLYSKTIVMHIKNNFFFFYFLTQVTHNTHSLPEALLNRNTYSFSIMFRFSSIVSSGDNNAPNRRDSSYVSSCFGRFFANPSIVIFNRSRFSFHS